jgi:hypothetical protein
METWERESLHQKLRNRDGVPPRPKGMAIAMAKDSGREKARSQGSTGVKPVRSHQPKPAPVIDELGIAVADHAVNGLPNHKIAEKLGVPLLQVEMARKLAPVRSRIKQLQIERRNNVTLRRDAAQEQALANLLTAGEALKKYIEAKLADKTISLDEIQPVLDIYKDAMNRVGFPEVKSIQSKHAEVNFGEAAVLKLLDRNRGLRGTGTEGGVAEVEYTIEGEEE